MKKTTLLKVILLTFMFIQSFWSVAQNLVPFTPRYNEDIKGDMLLIGNSILNRRSSTRNPNQAYNGDDLNSSFSMEFINIDNGATPGIFNSSSANLVVPNSAPSSAPCYKIVYAALYWGAVTRGDTPVTNVRFRMPTGGYNDVVGTVIHNSTTAIGTSLPYACVADVTSLVAGAGNPNPEGTYTLANISSAIGSNGGTGLSAGWSLFIVYEDPKLPAKSITSFDGFSAISSTVNLDIPVTGFRTIPTGPVRAKFAFSALEGDRSIAGDNLSINGSVLTAVNNAGTTIRAANNFFNSTVTYIDPATNRTENFLDRTPNSSNTLGYDAGILQINNNGNAIINNNNTSATIGLRSNQDVYFYYFNAIALDIIAPNIVLTKQVFSDASLTNNIGNANVTLGQELYYAVGFQNIGNDNAENFTITDVLPININFDPNDIIVPNGSGITFTYTAATRTIVFRVPNNLVEQNDPRYLIRFRVRVVPECNDLSDACSNDIQNQAFANYVGVESDIVVDDQRSLATFGSCFLGTPAPTNFLVGTENCVFTQNYQLCGPSVVLTAANGYNAYSWSTSPSGTPVIGTNQSITVNQTGTYYVTNTAIAPCRSIRQVVTVSPAGSVVANPVIPFADQVVTCPNDGKQLPKIFLCGANASRLINTGASDAVSIQWQRLNEGSCPGVGLDDCANENSSCTWSNVGTGSSYTADTSGQYRVVFNYDGGCFNVFYFNVFKNLLNPTADSRDIICTTQGQITVGGVPATGYEFSLNATGPFQTSNVFPITTPGTYTVYIRQQGVVSNPCLFTVPSIDIRRRDFTVSEFVSQPLCNGDRGSIRLAANDVRPQYFYTLRQNGNVVNAVGPIAASDFDFSNLTAGTYTYEVRTDDGCLGTGSINIIEPAILTATVNQTKALTCETGEVTVSTMGGTSPYAYYVNGASSPQFTNVINTPTPGLYQIRVVDFNGCSTNVSIRIDSVPVPVYNTVGTNVNCYNDTTGVINFNMTNANGYIVTYSIDNGLNYGTSGVISGLAAGTYNTILKYTLNGVECLEPMRPITITQPAAALTASAGVSQLAGCGPAGEGRVRITNVTGGVAPYQFSFDNQASWTTVNNALKAPGSYILYVRDSNNCIFQAPVTVDPAPAAPAINVATPVDFNCDGTATSTVTVNNPGNANYTYDYFLDGVRNTNTPPNVFLNVTPGTHNIRVEYRLSTVSTFSNLLNEDFGIGANTTTPGIASAYCFHDLDVVPSTCSNPALTLEDNQYVVTRGLVPNNPAWFAFRDHTTAGANPNGRFLAVNIGEAAGPNGVLYSKVINDVIPNQPVIVEAYLANLLRANFVGAVDPSFSFELVDSSGNIIAQQPPIPPTPNPTGIPPIPTIPRSNTWVLRSVSLNPGNNTTLTFRVRSGSIQYNGNDAAIDDIRVFQLPEACITARDFTIEVPTGQAFDAQVTGQRNVSCAGGADGGFTITAQNFEATTGFEYSLNNGVDWITSFTSPVVINTLGANTYTVLARPVGSTITACSKTFAVTITAPTAVTATATILTPATCTTGATIRATGGGGTPAYQYELRAANGTTVITAFNNNRDFTNVSAGDYTVFVRDANNCSNPVGFAITVTASPAVTATLDTTTDYCYTTANPATLVVNVAGGTGPFTYQLDSSASISSALTTYSFANVTPGTHTILVTDSNNCTATISNIVIAPQLGFNVSLINDLTCLVDASIGNPVITGGNGTPYTYTVSRDSGTPAAVTSFPYTTTQAGSYVFTVTDSRGCTASSNAIIVTPRTTPAHTTAKTDISCNGLSNGTITVTPSGGFTTTYTYAIKLSTATTYSTQATNQFTGLAAGTYDIKVIDSKGCESTPTQVTIINPDPIVVTATATPFTCSPTNVPQSAVVTIGTPSGGTGTYSYSFNGGSFTNTTTLTVNNGTNTVNYQVRDSNGCLSPLQTITLQQLNSPTDLTFSNAAVTCTATTTTVAVTATNGVGTLQYETIAPSVAIVAKQTSNSFAGLLPGLYTFRVTDANGCYYTESHNIAPVTPIAVAANKTSDVLCQGGSTGSGTYTVSGNATVGAYTFTLTSGTLGTGTLTQLGNVLTLSNVAAGTYTVRVRDNATGCEADGTITINQPAAPLAITNVVATNFNCNNDNAQITVTATGGTTAYGYAAVIAGTSAPTIFASSNVVTVDTVNGTELSWDVYVRDANGCITVRNIIIAGDPAPAAPVVTVPNQCTASGSGFTITVTPVMGPLGPYSYGISGATGAFQALNTFNVAPGTYTVLVRDRNGCISAGTAVTVAAQLTAGAGVTKALDCSGTPDAIISGTINGGRAPFTVVVSSGTGPGTIAQLTATTFTYTTAVAGAYTFTITDANGCTTNASATIAAITNPTVAAIPTQVTCFGGANGAVTLAGSGGSGGYQYSFNGSPFTTTATYTGLIANTPYSYQVRDSNSCVSAIGSITLTQPTAVSFAVVAPPFSCNATTNASQSTTITVTPSGGTGTYSYSYDNGATFVANATRVVNDNGLTQTFNVIVRDANGCLATMQTVVLAPLNKPTDLSFTPSSAITCSITAVDVQLATTNGVLPLSYVIISGPVVNTTGVSTGNFTGLTPGNYVFRVTDANGCFYTESYNIAPVTPIAVSAVKLTDVACFGDNTGSGQFTVTGFSAPGNYTINVTTTPASLPFTLSPTGDVRTLTNLVAGTYTFTVTDNTTGCIDSESITITQPTAGVSITSAVATPVFCSNDNSQITITATGGTPSYGYAAVPNGNPAPTTFGTTNVVTVDTNNGTILSWDVYIRDANACVTPVPTTVNITNNGAPTVTATVANQCSASGSAFQIVATATGGLAPYTYTINTGVAPSPGNTFTVAPGTYIITATDANGCPSTTSVTVNQRLTALAAVTKDITCSLPVEATIRVTISGGIAPFTYRVNINGAGYSGGPIAVTGNSFIYTAPGNTGVSYEFEITDANGTPSCVAISNVVTTNTPVTVTATEVHVDPTCNGFSNGSIRLTATAGEAPFTYSISGISGLGSANVFGGLTAGSYDYIVRDAKGCDAIGTIVLDNPPAIVVNIVTNPILCNANTPGSFDVSVTSGGTAPYTYRLFDNAFTQIDTYTETSNATTPVHSFMGLNFGDYYITVVDANGCEFRSPRTRIETPPFLTFTGIVDSNNCATGVDYTVTTTGGVGPFRYSVFGQTETAPTASNVYTFTGLLHGVTYFLQVRDSAGCISILEVTMPPAPSTIAITGTVSSNVTCNGVANGSLAFTVENFDPTVTAINYEVLNALTLLPLPTPINGQLTGTAGGPFSGNITTLPAGNYVLRATEDTGTLCSASYTFTITQPAQPLTSAVTNNVNANCNSGALVTLTTTGGTGPYTYAAAVAPGPATTFNSGNVLTLNPGAAGTDLNWIITVRDANNCTVDVPVTIAVDPSPVIALEIVNKCAPQGAFEIRVDEVTAGTGAYSISVDGSTFTSIAGLSHTVSGLNSGSHTIIIRDANGCTDTETIIIDEPLVATPLITALPTCADNDGVITMTGTGGPVAGTYTYTISPTAPSVVINNGTGVISGLPAGTYTITMTDTATPTACSTTAEVTLSAAIPVTFTTATTPALCVGDSNGTITVTLGAGNNNPSYTYEITAPITRAAQSSNIFTGLAPGTYTVRVNSGRGCSTDDNNVVVAPATPLTSTFTVDPNTTCSPTTLITVNGTGGTGSGYTYNFNGLGFTSVNTFTVNNVATPTPVTYIVRDANGCETPLQSISTPAFTPPTDLSFAITTEPTCLANTATVQVTVTGGLGTPAFEIISPATATGNISGATSGEFTLLAPGDYIFRVTDDNGCTRDELFTVDPVTPIAIVAALVNDITCNPANGTSNNGSASFTVTGFSTTGNYSINVTSVPVGLPFTQLPLVGDVVTLTDLQAGTYTVTVRDNTTLCEATDDITITLPNPITFATTATKVYCTEDDSVITVGTVSGGTGVYEYAAVPASSTAPTLYSNIPVLSVDTVNGTVLTWDVYVRDANGCVGIVPVTIVNDAEPTIVAPATQYYTGTPLIVNLDAVTTVYLGSSKIYTLDGSVVAGPTVTLNGPGTYVLGVRDDNGCEDTVNYTVVDQLIAGALLDKDLTCAPTPAATINVTITGGVGPFTVQTLVGGVPTGAAVPGVVGPVYTFNPTTAGIYSFEITDSYLPTCSVTTNTVEVTTPVTPAFTAVATDATCNGDSNGTITVTPTAGVAPFTFALSGTGANNTGDATGNYSGLPAGSYTVTITDAKGCPATSATPIIIGQPDPVTVSTIVVSTPLSCGAANVTQAATVTVTPLGGNGSYQYNFNGQGWTTDNFYITSIAGPVNVLVRDTNLCTSAVASTTVDALDPPTGMDITGTLIYCAPATSTTSTVTISNVQNGVGPFTYQMVSPTSINNGTSNVFAGLAADDYLFQVTDANGCTYQELYTVAARVNIAATVATITNETCFNANDGAATITVNNSAGYTVNLTLGTGTIAQSGNTVTLSALAPSNYNLQVLDSTTGCTADVPFTIVGITQVLDFTTTATNINCDVDTAIITVTATGGTLDYQYAVVPVGGTPAATAFGLSNQLTVDTNSGANMQWDVYVRDANGCEDVATVTILPDANPTIANAVATQCPSAAGTYEITVTASGFSAALEYSADGTNYQTGNVITVNAPGNYNITVRDANGCESVAFPVSILTPLVVNPLVSIPVSCAGNDGVVNVSATGGSGNHQYNIDGGAFGTSSAFNAVAAGNHIIGVRDTTTSCEVFVPVNLQAATLVTGFALAKSDVTCNGGADGTITASFDTPAPGVNDNPVYLYSLNGGMPQASNQFTGLTAGTYTVQVVSARGCDATATIVVDEPDQIVVPAPAVVQFGCASGNASNLATITVTGVTGGSNTYLNYEFLRNGTRVQFGPSNVYTETVLTGGNYTVNVFDSNGCIGTSTTPIDIVPYIEIDTVSVAVNQAITCTDLENITVSVTTIGGTASNLQYTLVDRDPTTGVLGTLYPIQTNTTGVFTNLPIGDYNISVRNLDTGCEVRAVHFVNNPNTFELVVNATTDVTCLNDTNGTATITLVDRLITTTPLNGNDAGPFSYTLQNAAGVNVGGGTAPNAGPLTLTGLAAGTYTVSATLSQTPDCTVVTNFTIAAPTAALDITETHTEITCVTGNNDGSISVAATGGWPGAYQFELVGPTAAQSVAYGTQTVFTGLTAGSYTVNVRDSRGCVNSEIVVLNNPTPIAFTAAPSTTLVDCINDTSASITVTTGPTGGSGSYLYTLIRTDVSGAVTTSGPQVANTFTNLGAGSYQVQVTDSWSCSTTSAAMVINEPTRVTAALTLATAITCATDATITLTAAGGTAPYDYSTTPDFSVSTAMPSNSVTFSVPVGTYSYYVRDNNGCISFISNDVKIDDVPTLTLDLDVQNATINCTGDASGVIVAVAQGGLGNYVYTLLDSAGNPVSFTVTQTTPGNFTNIPAGNYVVRVVSEDCAAVTSSIVPITEPLVALTQSYAVTPITCAGEGDGRIVITASGGTGIIKYAISPRLDQFFESGVFENLRPGFYEYIVQDENGCFENVKNIEITEPGSVFATVVPNSQIPEVCAGDADGAFSINITGGNAPYSVSLNNRNGTYTTGTPTQTQFDFSGLSGNEQIVYIRDANGCESDFTVMLGEPVTLNPQRTIVYDCVNNTQVNSVTITVDASNDPADLDYALDGSTVFQASNVFSNLSPGAHTVDVRHTNGCIKQVRFVIDQVDPITISLADGGLNEIVATATGGFGNYQFSLNGEPQGNKNSFIIYRSGDYTVTVTDANGCTATATRFFEYIDIKIPNVFTPNGDGNNDTWAPTNTINYKDLNFEVFDRYGRKLGSFREGESWDGKYNGTELPSGDYWYILRLRDVNDPRQFVGHFTLYR